MKYKTSYKVYPAWNYEKELEDLNNASEQGWQLVKGGCFHSRFVNNPDVRYRYQLDYGQIDDMGRYIETFREQGWEYVNSTFNNWHYFRKLWDPALPEEEYEIFTDRESLKEMNGRWVKLATGLGIVLLLFAVLWIIRLIRQPQLPVLVQLLIYFFEGAILLRGAAVMRNPDASRKSRGGTALMAVFLAVILIGTGCVIGLYANRPGFRTESVSEDLLEPMVDNRLTDFEVKYADNYFIDLGIDAKAPFTIEILDESGRAVFSKTASSYEEDNIKLRLTKGRYRVSISCDEGYHLKLSIE